MYGNRTSGNGKQPDRFLPRRKESGYEVECHSPFELGTRNIDWLHEMWDDVVWRQLEGKENVEPETEKS